MIKLQNLSVGYASEQPLISDISAELAGGELVGLLGRNGCGKSTLMRTIVGLERLRAGEVFIDGIPSGYMTNAERARRVSFVATERLRVANLTCRELVALGRAPYTNWIGAMQDEDEAIVRDALERVGAAAYALRSCEQLSDGELQRVMIARALAQGAQTIVLDEPTAFLDMPSRHELALLLQSLAHDEGKVVLFSTHELDIAYRTCDKLLLVQSGSLCQFFPSELSEADLLQKISIL